MISHKTVRVSKATLVGFYACFEGDDNMLSGARIKVIGNRNDSSGTSTTIIGNYNRQVGANPTVDGDHNTSRGHKARIRGNFNDVYGPGSIVVGNGNTIHADDCDVTGIDNIILGRNCTVNGQSTTPKKRVKYLVPPLSAVEHDTVHDVVTDGSTSTPCVVCITNKVRCINLPCGDTNMCISCARSLAFGTAHATEEVPKLVITCPTCRDSIAEIKRLFL